MHQIVVTVLCRLPPPFLKVEVRHGKKTLSLWEVLLFLQNLQNLQHESPVFPPPGDARQNVTRNGGPQFGASLILPEHGRTREA